MKNQLTLLLVSFIILSGNIQAQEQKSKELFIKYYIAYSELFREVTERTEEDELDKINISLFPDPNVISSFQIEKFPKCWDDYEFYSVHDLSTSHIPFKIAVDEQNNIYRLNGFNDLYEKNGAEKDTIEFNVEDFNKLADEEIADLTDIFLKMIVMDQYPARIEILDNNLDISKNQIKGNSKLFVDNIYTKDTVNVSYKIYSKGYSYEKKRQNFKN